MVDNQDSLRDSLLNYVGSLLSQADEVITFCTTVLGLIRFLAERYKKQKDKKEFKRQEINELRHEMGAISVLSKEMRRQARNGIVFPDSVKELAVHVKKANKISREMNLTADDPDFDFVRPDNSAISKLQKNEPALLVLEALFDEIRRYSDYAGSHLT
ncbi:MAG: hypothetical protein JRM94_03290 [Nitrososphaerota archaeon]|nr:hypothetical protein [Nitrososphaerota archaeon]